MDADKLCDVLIGVFCPPALVYMRRKCSSTFCCNLILWLLVIGWPFAIIHAFHVAGYRDLCHNALCVFFPPVTACLRFGCGCRFLISLVLWFLGLLPSTIYTYYQTW